MCLCECVCVCLCLCVYMCVSCKLDPDSGTTNFAFAKDNDGRTINR